MNETSSFDDAVKTFKDFLGREGHPTTLIWVFRDDIWRRSPVDVVLRVPSQETNLALARKVFAEGCVKGLVNVHAIASVQGKVAATVWFPKLAGEEVQGWSCGTKFTITQPLPNATAVGAFRWFWFRRQLKFRLYQSFETTIGTKVWALSSPDRSR